MTRYHFKLLNLSIYVGDEDEWASIVIIDTLNPKNNKTISIEFLSLEMIVETSTGRFKFYNQLDSELPGVVKRLIEMIRFNNVNLLDGVVTMGSLLEILRGQWGLTDLEEIKDTPPKKKRRDQCPSAPRKRRAMWYDYDVIMQGFAADDERDPVLSTQVNQLNEDQDMETEKNTFLNIPLIDEKDYVERIPQAQEQELSQSFDELMIL